MLFVNLVEDLQLYKRLTFRVPFVRFPSLCYEGDTEQDRHCNIEAHSYNHGCSGKAINVTYSECVFLALVIQHAKLLFEPFCFNSKKNYDHLCILVFQ
jgi:hypothetical protein